MKTNALKIFFTVILLIGVVIKGFGQREQVIVNLSDPSLKGYLNFSNPKGSVKITGYGGNALVITAVSRYAGEGNEKKEGTRLFSVDEKNNNVTLFRTEYSKTIDFDLKIPRNFSVKVNSLDNGTIEIISLNGDIDASNTSGDVILSSITGSAVVSTINGKIRASFLKTGSDTPMMFTSLEGSIEISIPEKTGARLKMRSQNGKLFSDFKIRTMKQQVQSGEGRLISDEGWTVGTINNGGPEYMISSYNGNIYLRKNTTSL
jgi:hypothetical protein